MSDPKRPSDIPIHKRWPGKVTVRATVWFPKTEKKQAWQMGVETSVSDEKDVKALIEILMKDISKEKKKS